MGHEGIHKRPAQSVASLHRARKAGFRDDGVAAVEFALVAPILIVLVFGIIAFGLVLAQLQSLNNASRQMARVGAVGLNTCGEMVGQSSSANTIGLGNPLTVDVQLAGAGVCTATVDSGGDVTYSLGNDDTVACPSGNVANSLTVTTSAPAVLRIPLLTSLDFTLTGKGVFQCEIT